MVDRAELARDIVAASHALHARGWVANHDGNVSVRLSADRLMVTPTATGKGDVTEGGLAITDYSGKPAEGDCRPPSEFLLHVYGCYRARQDVGAVVHAHPPYATALACAGIPIRTFLAEAVVSLGADVPLTTFAMPFGEEGAAPIAALIDRYDALLLAQHGVLTVGKSVEQAMMRMELVEHMARIWTIAQPLGGVKELPAAAVEVMLGKRRKAAGSLGSAAARAGLSADAASSGGFDTSTAARISAPGVTEPSALPSRSWTPAGPPPAPDAWSGGKTEGACSVVYGAGDLASTVRAEIKKHSKG